MTVQEIRQIVKQRPFEPFIFHLDNGERRPMKSPEIVVSNELIVSVDDKGKSILIAPETVTATEFYGR